MAAALLSLTWTGMATASPPGSKASSDDDAAPAGFSTFPAGASGVFGFLDGIDRSSNLFGDLWGVRPFLGRAGITLSLSETSEILGNVRGGVRRGFDYDGLTTASLQMDSQRAFGWYGGSFNASGLEIHGRNLSTDNLATLQTASGIEADRSVRLWELWYQQKFLDEDRLDVKIGQQSLDQEFMVSQNALLFVNTMFGWPMLPSADMPGGGPAYPLSALGLRLRGRPTDEITLLAGLFNGSPAPGDAGDPQKSDRAGLSFPAKDGPLAIAELQYAYPSLGTVVYADQTEPLARLYKLGVWFDGKRFADQHLDAQGLSLANPASSGNPRLHDGDTALYAVGDRMLWRDPEEPDRTVNLFVRAMGAPDEDRNLIDFSLNAGLTMHEPFLHRDDDTVGIGLGLAHVGAAARALDRDQAAYGGQPVPIRGTESFVEATYQYQAAGWWQLQPDIQYVFNPGGGLANPYAPGQTIGNELVLGLRTNILF